MKKLTELSFSCRLKEFMDLQGLSAAQMAELLGVTPSYVSQILSGKRKRQRAPVLLRFAQLVSGESMVTGTALEAPPQQRPMLEDNRPSLGRDERDRTEAEAASSGKKERMRLLQLMAVLRRVADREDVTEIRVLNRMILGLDSDVAERWPEIRHDEIEALRQLLEESDAEGQDPE